MSLDRLEWALARGSGVSAFVLLTVAVALGLALSLRLASPAWPRVLTSEAHRLVTLLALWMTGLHVALLLVDAEAGFSVGDVLLPFAAGYRPAATALGVLALYAVAAVWATTLVRNRLGYRLWRRLHALAFVAYGAACCTGSSAEPTRAARGRPASMPRAPSWWARCSSPGRPPPRPPGAVRPAGSRRPGLGRASSPQPAACRHSRTCPRARPAGSRRSRRGGPSAPRCGRPGDGGRARRGDQRARRGDRPSRTRRIRNNAHTMRILVVDDEPAVLRAVRRGLVLAGYEVELAEGGEEALAALAAAAPDAVVLDVLMPGVDGLEVCRRLRAAGDRTPVLMLTARDAVADRVTGLDAGADDYLVKPFALEELLARLRALLRRTGPNGEGALLRFGDLVLDTEAFTASRGERRIELTRTEFALLELFMRNPRRVLSRTLIHERVWGYDFGPTSNALGVYVGYLRRKLEAEGEPRLIQTVRGVGYVLRGD